MPGPNIQGQDLLICFSLPRLIFLCLCPIPICFGANTCPTGAMPRFEVLHRQIPTAITAPRAIGLPGQMHGATLLDGNDPPASGNIVV